MARFDTKKLHAGYNPADHNYAVSVPIYATTAFELGTVARSDDMFSFDSWDALYSRLSNPTTDVLEARLVELHDATAAVSLASGMAAFDTCHEKKVSEVFVFADRNMYENKKYLKMRRKQ